MGKYYQLNVPRDTWDELTGYSQDIKGFSPTQLAIWCLNMCVTQGMSPYKVSQAATGETKKPRTKENNKKIKNQDWLILNKENTEILYNLKELYLLMYSPEEGFYWNSPAKWGFTKRMVRTGPWVRDAWISYEWAPEFLMETLLSPTDTVEPSEEAQLVAEPLYYLWRTYLDNKEAINKSERLKAALPKEEDTEDDF